MPCYTNLHFILLTNSLWHFDSNQIVYESSNGLMLNDSSLYKYKHYQTACNVANSHRIYFTTNSIPPAHQQPSTTMNNINKLLHTTVMLLRYSDRSWLCMYTSAQFQPTQQDWLTDEKQFLSDTAGQQNSTDNWTFTSCGVEIQGEATLTAIPGNMCGHDSTPGGRVTWTAQNWQRQLDHVAAATEQS